MASRVNLMIVLVRCLLRLACIGRVRTCNAIQGCEIESTFVCMVLVLCLPMRSYDSQWRKERHDCYL